MGWIQSAFAPLRRNLPRPVSDAVRSTVTAGFTPFFHYYKWGHFRSSFARRAVDQMGKPLPWYTYPCIEFLRRQDFHGKTVLEFGAGQSTLWWASRGATVVSLEGDKQWYDELCRDKPANVSLHFTSFPDEATCVANVRRILDDYRATKFDFAVIDGLCRFQMIEIAISVLASNGAIICDDSMGYRFFDGFKGSGLRRVDFYGPQPGVVEPSCTSIFFRQDCPIFDNTNPI